MTDQPIGEFPDIETIETDHLEDRVTELERENYRLQILLDQARTERDDANIRAWTRDFSR